MDALMLIVAIQIVIVVVWDGLQRPAGDNLHMCLISPTAPLYPLLCSIPPFHSSSPCSTKSNQALRSQKPTIVLARLISILSSARPLERCHTQSIIMSTTTTTATQSITADQILRLFPEVNPTTIAEQGTTDSGDDLEGYDAEQVRLMEEMCIVLDGDDKPIGTASKKLCKHPSFQNNPIKPQKTNHFAKAI